VVGTAAPAWLDWKVEGWTGIRALRKHFDDASVGRPIDRDLNLEPYAVYSLSSLVADHDVAGTAGDLVVDRSHCPNPTSEGVYAGFIEVLAAATDPG